VNTSYRDVELEDFTGDAVITLDNGRLTLKPASLDLPLEVKGTYCEIDLHWPQGIRRSLEAQAKNGTIHWELLEEPAVNVTNGQSILKAFPDDNPPVILLSTTYADITIRKHQD
jgi:hypothetical protein